jgi:glycosyltransferase involved in cell wall biosynthesis
MRVAEARLCEAFDLVAAIQEREAQALRALAPRARVEVIPMGIDYSRFLPHAPASPPVVLLTGAFGWAPNAEGARAFVSNGWPRVAARVPGARLRVVGKDLSLDLEHSIRAAGGEPVGYVDSITPEYAVATVLVVPLWVGAGVRVKIVEALGAGPVVVSTPLGAEGLGLERDRHFVEAGTPEELGEAVARLLLAPELARAIADEGRRFAQERFSISAVSRRTIELVERVLETRASGARA